jgi:glyoxylase-like metal-dependent hydrolase (beta-lactamase superfamily II)
VPIEAVVSGFLDENCYLVSASNGPDTVVIDPGVGTAAPAQARLQRLAARPVAIVLTHGHPDHIWDAAALAEALAVPVYLPAADERYLADPLAGLAPYGLPTPADFLGGGPQAVWRRPQSVTLINPADDGAAVLALGSLTFEMLACPGHTPGSAVFRVVGADEAPFLLTGDVLFRYGIGRTDLPGGDPAAMTRSLRTLVGAFDHAAPFYPGHGAGSTIGRELLRSPFLTQALEV